MSGDGQMTLDDAARYGDAGVEVADGNVADEWKAAVDEFARRYLETHRTLFTDDLQAVDGFPETGELRALGARFRSWAKAGWMRKATGADVVAGRVAETSRPSTRSKGTHKPIWISLLWD